MKYNDLTQEGTKKIAVELGKTISQGDFVLLFGELGSGKTFFTNELCKSLNVKSIVNSPSYVLLNEYKGDFNIYHYDLYRLTSSEDAINLAILERLQDGITIIEWPQLIKEYLPSKRIEIYFEHNLDLRNIEILDNRK